MAEASRFVSDGTRLQLSLPTWANGRPGSSLDRIDNDGNYSPENCRWSTKADQQRNQRVTRHVIIEGVRYRAADLADLSGHKTDTILDRVARGMTYAEVVNSGSFVTAAHLATAGGGKASGAKKRARTHCKRGHAFSAANTYNTAGGHRACRACHNAKMKRRNLAAREARAEISARSTFP